MCVSFGVQREVGISELISVRQPVGRFAVAITSISIRENTRVVIFTIFATTSTLKRKYNFKNLRNKIEYNYRYENKNYKNEYKNCHENRNQIQNCFNDLRFAFRQVVSLESNFIIRSVLSLRRPCYFNLGQFGKKLKK